MSVVLLAGHSGRLGSAVASKLLDEGFYVVGVSRSKSKNQQKIKQISFDLSLQPLPKDFFKDVEYVINCSGAVGLSSYEEFLRANALSVKNLLYNSPDFLKKVISASSISVYGVYPNSIVTESFLPKPDTSYGKSKLLGEQFCKEYSKAKSTAVFRLGMLYGSNFKDGYYQVLDLLLKNKMQIIGSGENRIPLIHQADATQAFLDCINSKNPIGYKEYNIVGKEYYTQKQLLYLAAKKLNVSPPKKHLPYALAKVLIPILHLLRKTNLTSDHLRQLASDRAYSYELAKKEFGFEAKIKLEDGLNQVIEQYLKEKGEIYGKS